VKELIIRISAVFLLLFTLLTATFGQRFSEWSDPVNMEAIEGTDPAFNTPYGDGCPIQSPDGLSFFMASNRPGGLGGQDIWIATRPDKNSPWGAPVNAGAPINSTADDFCPSPAPGNRFFFISTREQEGACGAGDIYFSKKNSKGIWQEPENLGCDINSPGMEWSPSYFQDENGHGVLYFASNRPDGHTPGGTDLDIYYTVDFGPAQLAQGVNTEFDDARPNVRHDGLEIVFDSTRPGTLGGPDVWTASRNSTDDDWNPPIHLPAPINSAGGDTRASLSWDGKQMVVGSNRPGSELDGNGNPSGDIWVMTRERLNDHSNAKADFDGDGVSDISVFRPSNGTWHILQSGNGQYKVEAFGMNNDKPVPGDYDGDGTTDYAVFRPSDSTWYMRYSSDNSFHATRWGLDSDVLVPADYDGDKKTDIAVYRNGTWYILRSSDGQVAYQFFGLGTDIPAGSVQ
jgi:hypothetical protein